MASVVSSLVEVCVFRFRESMPEFLLLRRAADEPVHPGIWQIITGTAHERETALAAARRELQEETLLTPLHFWVVPHVTSFYDHRRDAVMMIPFFAAQTERAKEPTLSREHDDYTWLPLDQALRRLVWPGQRQGVEVVSQYIAGGEQAARFMEIG
jgi:8-oxo-dGTP pyrophosphatase MutT (NUDIX family)